jgi:4-hydroxybutyrate CoA-transferase
MGAASAGRPEELRERIVEPAAALARIGAGDLVVVGASNAEPRRLVEALLVRSAEVPVRAMLWPGGFPTPLADPELKGRVELLLPVPNAGTAAALASGQATYLPGHLHHTLGRLAAGEPKVDAALVMLGPPDAAGYCSFGVSAVNAKPYCEAAGYVVAEINERMPRPRGDAAIHLSRIDAVVPTSEELREFERLEIGEVPRAIGERVAAIVPDGATIEIGIGALPDAVLAALAGHRDLAIRSGIVGDGILGLVAAGALREPDERGAPLAAGSVLGTRRLYEFVDDNDLFELHDGNWTHDPLKIAAVPRFFAINSAIEIDLSGQVNAEQIGARVVAGLGGQSDFIRGARLSDGGASILVMASTAGRSRHSRIVRELAPGVPVSLGRGDVEWVVTEFGAVNLDGLDLDARAAALASVAAPEHRDALLAAP